MPLYEIVVDVGVCGGYDYEVGMQQQLGSKGSFASVQFAVLFVLGDVGVVEGYRCSGFLQLFDNAQGGTFAVIVYVLFVRYAENQYLWSRSALCGGG